MASCVLNKCTKKLLKLDDPSLCYGKKNLVCFYASRCTWKAYMQRHSNNKTDKELRKSNKQ